MLTDGLRFLEGSTNTNLVLPVVTATEKSALLANIGEVVFQSDGTSGLYVYDGTQWVLGIDISPASSPIAASRLPAFTGDVTSTAGSGALTLAVSGVTAGTYKSVTVNAKGLVTAGTNPTTLAAYGITDAYTKAQVDMAVSNASGGVITFASIAAKPTTISGYGILDAYTKTQVDTAITNATPTLTFASLSGKPTTLSGYGITDGVLSTDVRLTDARAPLAHTHVIADVTNLQSSLDDKLTKNSDIVPGTSFKISYDSKGLITGSAGLSAIDIPALSTDAINSGVFSSARLPAEVVYTVGGALPSGLIPAVSLTGTITPDTYADMTAATAASATGTVAIVTADSDLTKNATYVKGTDGTWKILNVATNNVASINGKTGNISKILPEDIFGVFDADANSTLLSEKLPLFTGDVTSTSAARSTLTLNAIPGLNAGASYSSVTVNSKGLVTGGVVGTNYTTVQADAKFVTKLAAGEKNIANGYLGLNATGKIEATYLPLFDGDVVSTSGARNTLTLKPIGGLVAGTYSSVTINTKGLVTGGTLGENYTKVESDTKYLTKAVSGARNVAEGFVGLNADGKIDPAYLPVITTNDIKSVTTIAERDALSGVFVGDMAIVGGVINKTYIASSVSPTTWTELLNPVGGVTSLNGNVGVVNIDLSNIPGTLTVAKMPIYTTGDVITNATSKDLELQVINGLTAGSYTKVTVNTKGIVTSATNPTTILEYGILDAYTKAEVDTAISNATPVLTFTSLTDKPTTITGYGILDAYTKAEVDTAISNATPVLTFTSLTGKPTTISGYGILDAYTKAQVDTAISNATPVLTFTSLTGKPTTLVGYGITDGVASSDIRLTDARAPLAHTHIIADVTNLQTSLDAKLSKNTDIVAGTATKITYDVKGLVTAGAALVEADLPSLAISKITNLQTSLDTKLAKNVDIIAGTGTKITYDAKGLVLSSTSVSSSDLPNNLVYTTGGKIDSNLLPSIALTSTYVITDVDADATNIDTYTIGATLGSIAILTNISKTYIVSATDPAVVWTELLAPTDSVKSVNGKSGSSISLSYDDIDSGSSNIVTAGSYNTVTVNTKGRVTAASNTAYAALDGSNKMNAANLPTFIGDVTLDTATNTLSLSTVANVAGTYNTATAHAPLTIDSKGRVSAVGSAVTITPAFADITGKPTTLSGYGISDSVELTANKNTASGYAGLDSSSKVATSVLPASVVLLNASGKIDSTLLPAVPLSNTFVVSDAAANATNIDTYTTGALLGDIAILSSLSKTFILSATTPSKVWTELLSPTGGVTSINGVTGSTLTLTYANIDTASTDIVTAGTYNNVTVNAKGRVTAVANTSYATLDGSSKLLVTNLPALSGDVTTTAGFATTTVAKVNGTTIVNPATKTAGMVLSLDSDTTQATWKAISYATLDANSRIASSNLPLFAGDITTATSSATLTISKINGIPLDTTISGSALPTSGQALVYNITDAKIKWTNVAVLGANTFTGTQTATTFTSNVAVGTAPFSVTSTTLVPNLNVSKLNGIDITGTPAVGHVLTATSATAASWAAGGGGGGGTSDTSATANTIAKRTSDGSLYATNFYSTSDLLLKANVQELSDNLDVSDAISKLAPKAFTFKDDSENKQHYGLIAQDVEEVLPALVSTNDDGFKSVNYVEIIALLLAEVKTLSARVNALESA
jgi:phage-related tail fiber protein